MEWSSAGISMGLLMLVQTVAGAWIIHRMQTAINTESERTSNLYNQVLNRSGILFEERLAAFRALRKQLLIIRAYCEDQIGKLQGSEFGQNEVDDYGNCLSLHADLRKEFNEHRMLLTADSRARFASVLELLTNGRSMELGVAENESRPVAEKLTELQLGTETLYSAVAVAAEKCLQSLFDSLKFPPEIL